MSTSNRKPRKPRRRPYNRTAARREARRPVRDHYDAFTRDDDRGLMPAWAAADTGNIYGGPQE